MIRGIAAAACFAAFGASAAPLAPDDARESRWAAEVAPQIVVGDAVWLATPHRARVLAIYATPQAPAHGALIVVHGAGVHPDWALIGELRTALADRGFATLSVQMPVLAADAMRSDYAALLPLAAERLDAAVAWLHARDQRHIVVVSHSMGAAMVDAWLAQPKHAAVDAWVSIGLPQAFSVPPRVPVLDVHAERDLPVVLASAPRRAEELPHDRCSAAVTLSATDHFLDHAVARAVERIVPFLDAVFAARC